MRHEIQAAKRLHSITRIRWLAVAAGGCALALMALSASRVAAVTDGENPQSEEKPCGQETPCEGRSSEFLCKRTYAQYYAVGTEDISTEDTSGETHVMQRDVYRLCTCEYECIWLKALGRCVRGKAHRDAAGNHICSYQKLDESRSFDVPR